MPKKSYMIVIEPLHFVTTHTSFTNPIESAQQTKTWFTHLDKIRIGIGKWRKIFSGPMLLLKSDPKHEDYLAVGKRVE